MTDKAQSIPARQKLIGIITLIIIIFVIYEIIGLFRGPGKSTTITPDTSKTMSATAAAGKPNGSNGAAPAIPSVPSQTPQPANVAAANAPTTQSEAQLLQLQQETQAKYVEALNNLQMLKVQRDIAETNQAIMTAKLSAVQSQKKMVDILQPPAPPPSAYQQKIVSAAPASPAPVLQTTSPYSVVSVSQIQYQWSAVIGYQNSLFSVRVGDVLPGDGSKIVAIDKFGVTLSKDGSTKRISLVPII